MLYMPVICADPKYTAWAPRRVRYYYALGISSALCGWGVEFQAPSMGGGRERESTKCFVDMSSWTTNTDAVHACSICPVLFGLGVLTLNATTHKLSESWEHPWKVVHYGWDVGGRGTYPSCLHFSFTIWVLNSFLGLVCLKYLYHYTTSSEWHLSICNMGNSHYLCCNRWYYDSRPSEFCVLVSL